MPFQTRIMIISYNVFLKGSTYFTTYIMQVKSTDEYFPTYRKLRNHNRHIIRDPSQPYRASLFDC